MNFNNLFYLTQYIKPLLCHHASNIDVINELFYIPVVGAMSTRLGIFHTDGPSPLVARHISRSQKPPAARGWRFVQRKSRTFSWGCMLADLCQEEAMFEVLWEHRGGAANGEGGWKASWRRWHLNWALKDE